MTPLIIGIAAAAFLLMLGAGIALVAGGRGNVDERLEQFVGSATTVEIAEEVERAAPKSDMADRLDKLMSGQNFFDPIKERIAKSDVKLRVSEYLVLIVISAFAVMGLALYFFGGSALLGALGFLFGLRLPRMYINFAANRRMNTFNNQLGDTLNLWVNALRSGYSVLQAMGIDRNGTPAPGLQRV